MRLRGFSWLHRLLRTEVTAPCCTDPTGPDPEARTPTSQEKPGELGGTQSQSLTGSVQCSAVHIHENSREDRVYADLIEGTLPIVILADGVSVIENVDGNSILVREGGIAAERAVEAARQRLAECLPQQGSVEHGLDCLLGAYGSALQSLKEQEIQGATTLLIALLWAPAGGSHPYWCYSYVGDGAITILSPNRMVDHVIVPERLLSAQKVERTAALCGRGETVPPVIGARRYEPGDLLFIASDGIQPLYSWLPREHKETLPYFIFTRAATESGWEDILTQCPNLDDDATLGVIRTENSKEP